MAEPITSALLVDYDSLHRSLAGAGGEAAARLATRVANWVAAIESGQLIGPGRTGRAIMIRRCYADPALAGRGSEHFAAAAFAVVDCPASGGGTRSADLNMAIDAIAALADPAGIDEFILLSAEPSLAPLLTRLKVNKRRTAIYADATTTPGYRALADAVLEIGAFAEFLLTHDAGDAAAAGAALDRAEIEAFARKVHAATNIPLFSPRTFAELFRILTEEIATNGYHFQTTAKNVADRLVETGRSVTRRQVVFIVKGLALKGHVFSTSDTPRRLAEVFREQARYLIDNAGLALDEQQERLLGAWLVDRVSATPAPVAAAWTRPPAAPSTTPVLEKEAPAAPPQATARPPEPAKPAPTPPQPPQPPATGERPAAPRERPVAAEIATAPPPAAETPPAETPAAAQPAPAPEAPAVAKPGPPMISPDEAKAAIAAKVAASVRIKPGSRLTAPAGGSPPTSPVSPEESRPSARQAAGPATPSEPESIESSILAAIAQAVDVLVEDSGSAKTKSTAPPQSRRRAAAPPPPPKPRPKAEPEPEARAQGDDIGDEIQRIIANYSRNRKKEPRK